jgi:hypothetical protein
MKSETDLDQKLIYFKVAVTGGGLGEFYPHLAGLFQTGTIHNTALA